MQFSYKLYTGPTERDEWLIWIAHIKKDTEQCEANIKDSITKWEIYMLEEDIERMWQHLSKEDIPTQWVFMKAEEPYAYTGCCYVRGYS